MMLVGQDRRFVLSFRSNNKKSLSTSQQRGECFCRSGSSRSNQFMIRIATWVPFFDEVDAIIFLAPISAFDQVLVEDRTVNRLVGSLLRCPTIAAD
jgi:hypothetical protein